MDPQTRATDLLLEHRGGSRDALDRLVPLLYDELREIAHRRLRGEQRGHTLATTALVNEAYLRLVDVTRVEWRDRAHFLAMASRMMRRVLVDYARMRSADRRGAGVQPMALDEALVVGEDDVESLVALDDALERLSALGPRLTQVVECRFFGGLSEEETAEALGVTTRTVQRDWVKARGWLAEAMGRPGE
jgi:RNA polymerase sigma factor (TIGR02999 family)